MGGERGGAQWMQYCLDSALTLLTPLALSALMYLVMATSTETGPMAKTDESPSRP